MDLFDFKGLSTEATIGKVLVLISLLLKVIGILVSMAGLMGGMAFMMLSPMAGFGALTMGIVAAMIVLSIVGIVLVWMALKKMEEKDFHGAAIMAIIAAFLPPLDIIVLIGAVLLFISPEGKK